MYPLRLTRKQLPKHQVKDEIDKALYHLLRLVNPRAIYLFGSAARGEMTDQSDLDFLLIFSFLEEIKPAARRVYQAMPFSNVPLDIVWTTDTEFHRKKDIGGVCMEAYLEGECLYDKRATV